MAHVLIGFAESLPAPEVVFSLLAAGHEVSAFSRGEALPLRHLPLRGFHLIPAPERDIEGAVTTLREVMSGKDAPDLILPLDDAGLWLVGRANIASELSAGAVGQAAEVALNKILQIEAAQAAGLLVPPTHLLRGPAEVSRDALPESAIVKPALAIDPRENFIQKGRVLYLSKATTATDILAHMTDQGPQLVQPLIKGVGQGVFGFATPDGVIGWSGHERVRMMNPHGSGSSACRRLAPSSELKGQITQFLALIGWQGPFMVELLCDEQGRQWFMELNGRMWGSLALARRQGFEYPAWAVAKALGGDVPMASMPDAQSDPGVMREFGRDLLHLAFVLRGPKSAFYRNGWPRFLPSLLQVLRPAPLRQFYNYDPAHPWFFLRHALHTVKQGLKR